MSFNDASARNHDACRVKMKRTECMGSLLNKRGRIDTLGPGDVTKVLDWVHRC
jgi:hypothetical protein